MDASWTACLCPVMPTCKNVLCTPVKKTWIKIVLCQVLCNPSQIVQKWLTVISKFFSVGSENGKTDLIQNDVKWYFSKNNRFHTFQNRVLLLKKISSQSSLLDVFEHIFGQMNRTDLEFVRLHVQVKCNHGFRWNT